MLKAGDGVWVGRGFLPDLLFLEKGEQACSGQQCGIPGKEEETLEADGPGLQLSFLPSH